MITQEPSSGCTVSIVLEISTPSSNWREQRLDFARKINFPCLLPSFHTPSYILPLEYVYLPFPFISPSFHSPLYTSPHANESFPFPCFLSSFHSHSYTLPLTDMYFPFPFFILFLHSPSYTHTCTFPFHASYHPSTLLHTHFH
jgi:hypothetical protein